MSVDEPEDQRILITQASAGMILSRPVLNRNGIALCGVGTLLSDALIQRLTLRGIKRLHVAGRPVPTRGTRPLSDQIAALRQRFRHVDDEPLMALIERAVEKELVRRS